MPNAKTALPFSFKLLGEIELVMGYMLQAHQNMKLKLSVDKFVHYLYIRFKTQNFNPHSVDLRIYH